MASPDRVLIVGNFTTHYNSCVFWRRRGSNSGVTCNRLLPRVYGSWAQRCRQILPSTVPTSHDISWYFEILSGQFHPVTRTVSITWWGGGRDSWAPGGLCWDWPGQGRIFWRIRSCEYPQLRRAAVFIRNQLHGTHEQMHHISFLKDRALC